MTTQTGADMRREGDMALVAGARVRDSVGRDIGTAVEVLDDYFLLASNLWTRGDLYIPLDVVVRTERGEIYLNVSGDELENMPFGYTSCARVSKWSCKPVDPFPGVRYSIKDRGAELAAWGD